MRAKTVLTDVGPVEIQARLAEVYGAEGRGSRHGEPAYGTGSRVVLTTAHLDHTPENCDPANLRPMCQGCHLHYDRDHHRETAAATRRARIAAAGQLALIEEAS
ncbi:hypothetical protein ABZ793_23595 [Micromonospora sp. NPDC047465]|uniref:hypothetical protein n=1 Tax=Micromonospora sp. NPDC047465 TaxID=3154813 RepID=UPI0033D237EC